jgi:HSP20 family protein
MAIVRWGPTRSWGPTGDVAGLHSTIDRLFSDMFGEANVGTSRDDQSGDSGGYDMPTFHLPVNIVDTEQGYRIQAPVPGFRPEDVEVTFSDGVLTINAKRSEEQTRQEGNYLRREVGFGNYWRQIALPGDVRADDIRATFDNGVLTVEVPRAPKPEPKKIEVKPGEQQRQLEGSGSKRS